MATLSPGHHMALTCFIKHCLPKDMLDGGKLFLSSFFIGFSPFRMNENDPLTACRFLVRGCVVWYLQAQAYSKTIMLIIHVCLDYMFLCCNFLSGICMEIVRVWFLISFPICNIQRQGAVLLF